MKIHRIIVLLMLLMSTVAVQAQNDESPVAITLERTVCFGACPAYTISILTDGTVIYNGERFVDVTGQPTSQIAPETVAQMIDALDEVGYFGWDESYTDMSVTDAPSVITSVTRDGVTHRIHHYTGDFSAPLALPYVEQWIDIMANSSQWTGVQTDVSHISPGMESPLITLQREPCFGFCPVYSVALFEDGTVVYTGIANVDKIGVQVLTMDAFLITGMAQRAQALGYFDWQDSYEQQVMTDQATVITSIQTDEHYKRIVRYGGDPNAPVGLLWIEDDIDQLVAELAS